MPTPVNDLLQKPAGAARTYTREVTLEPALIWVNPVQKMTREDGSTYPRKLTARGCAVTDPAKAEKLLKVFEAAKAAGKTRVFTTVMVELTVQGVTSASDSDVAEDYEVIDL